MDLKIINETLETRETIFEGTPEQGFECDMLLPDYCPDIRRILKCHVVPKVSQCYQNSDKVNVDGFIFIKVYYICDENKIHCYDGKVPFSKTLELKNNVDGVSVSVGAKTNYVNCRAVNQRRLDVRGAVTISTRVTGKITENVVCDAAGDGIQLRKKTASCSTLCAESYVQFSVEEEETVDLAVNAVLRSEATAIFDEVKIIPNKAILKGELKTTTVYTDVDGNAPVTVMHTFPISRIMDIDRLTPDCLLELKTDVVSVEVTPRQNEDGEFKKLIFDVKVNIFARCFDNREITVATDAYSTCFDCNFTTKKIPLNHALGVIDETFTYKTHIELSNLGIDKVLDLWSFAKNANTRVENSRLLVEIPVDVCAFFAQADGMTEFSENVVNIPFEYSLSGDYDNAFFDPDVKITSCSYTLISPNSVELRFEVKISGAIVGKQTDKYICEINMDYSASKTTENTPALIIYYCDEGEDVWNIAKKYNTCAECIMQENDLDCETIKENKVILIPSAN